jgi:hypothetical protein
MVPMLSPLLSAIGRKRADAERCLVCGNDIADRDPRVRLTGGGHVHMSCSTYRMRRRAQIARRMRVLPRG